MCSSAGSKEIHARQQLLKKIGVVQMSKCQYLQINSEFSICEILSRLPLGLGAADECFYNDRKLYDGMNNCELRKKGYKCTAEEAENFLNNIEKNNKKTD